MEDTIAVEKKRGRPPVELTDTRLLNDENLLRRIAEMYYNEGVSQENIANRVATSRQFVSRALQRARELGIVRITIAPDERAGFLQNLARQARSLLGLEDIIIVPGHATNTSTPVTSGVDSGNDVVNAIALAAQEYLDQLLTDNDTVAVSGGKRFIRNMLRHAHPTKILEHLEVVASIGFVEPHTTTGDANLIAYDLASMYGARHTWFPCPAFMQTPQEVEFIRQLPMVRRAYTLMQNATIVLTSVWQPEYQLLIDQGYLTYEDEERIKAFHPVADINHWLFDEEGRCVNLLLDPPPYFLTGLDLPAFKQRLRQGVTRIILVAGGNPSYLDTIRAIIRAGLVSILITDHLTAQQLVQR